MYIYDVKDSFQALWTHPVYSKYMTYYLNPFKTPENEVHDILEGTATTHKIFQIDPLKQNSRNVYTIANEDGYVY